MTLQSYTIINFYMVLFLFIGLILPAFIIYFTSAYKNYIALIASTILLGSTYFVVGENILVLLPFIFPILFTGFVGGYLNKSGEKFWQRIGYLIAIELISIMLGIIIIYFSYGRQDIVELIVQGFTNVFSNIALDDTVAIAQLDLMTWILMLTPEGTLPAFEVATSLSIAEKLNIIAPQIRASMASILPSFIMRYGAISGILSCWISSLMLARRVRHNKSLDGVKDFSPPPVFSSWKAPKWLTNVMMLLLLSSIIIQFSNLDTLINVSNAIQSIVLVVISIQGLAVINWWLKRKKINNIAIVILSILFIIFLSFILPWIGLVDIIFSVRTLDKHKELLNKKIEDMKKQVNEKMDEIDDKKDQENTNKNEDDSKNNNDNNESEDK